MGCSSLRHADFLRDPVRFVVPSCSPRLPSAVLCDPLSTRQLIYASLTPRTTPRLEVNEVASRLVKERVHGDALVVLPDAVKWLSVLDSDTLYTSEQLLTLARRHAPSLSGVLGTNTSPQPPIKTLLTIVRRNSFLPEFQAQHDHANCGDSCRHLSYLPRHPALSKPRRGAPGTTTTSQSLEMIPGGINSRVSPPSIPQSTSDVQMVIPTDPPSVCATAPDNFVSRSLSGESTTDVISTATLDVPLPRPDFNSIPASLYHAPKRQSVDIHAFAYAAPSHAEMSASLGVPVVDSEADGVWQKRLRRDVPVATREAQEAYLPDAVSNSSSTADIIHCDSHGLSLEHSLLDATSSLSSHRPDTGGKEDVEHFKSIQEPAWDHLNADVLQNVFQKLSCQDAIAASGVCKQWRAVILQDRVLLQSLLVKMNEQRPLRSGLPCPENMGLRLLTRLSHMHVPRLVQVAADTAGNGSACMLCANVSEVRGDWAGAVRQWKRAAKVQQPIAMYKLGHHLYKGDMPTLGRNTEDAVMWLQRFQRSVSNELEAEQQALAVVGGAPASNLPTASHAARTSCLLQSRIPVAGGTPHAQYDTTTGFQPTGGHRAAHMRTYPVRVSLRARLQAAAERRQQQAHSERSSSIDRSSSNVQTPDLDTLCRKQVNGAVAHASRDVGLVSITTDNISLQEGLTADPQGAVAQQRRSTDGGHVVSSQPSAFEASQVVRPRLRPESEKLRRMLIDALIILGYLYLDGDGTKKDNKEAVSVMRRAAGLGSDEAGRTLGWMYNTGQFGE